MKKRDFDIVVIGGGHAGVEAAWAAANMGARTALVTLDPSKIGVMSCNPAIGGLAKGQMVREIDALGGLMGLATDATGIMFKLLNTSKGPAVRSPRAQCDKHAYAREVQRLISTRPEIEVFGAAAESFSIETRESGVRCVTGVALSSRSNPDIDGMFLQSRSIVLTTGTFMRGLMHTGEAKTAGGRIGEAPAVGISAALRELGFELGRLKTGTPPRLNRTTIDWESLETQSGDNPPIPFSDITDRSAFPRLAQVECRITSTSPKAHDVIRANLHRAPMFSGQIESVGPRYCPSIEDKVVRFSQRETHHVFLEPESHESEWVYCNGIATSLPTDIQEVLVRSMRGCERAEVLQWGYAVEYDMVRPHQIDATCMTKLVHGLFLAGQINGTSGYEEAAGQGIVAGINAVRFARGEDLVSFGRDEAYIGVMMDDLVTKTPREPYRMFTSRAEHRLILRSDNAAERLTPRGRELGLVDDARWATFQARTAARRDVESIIEQTGTGEAALSRIIKSPNYTPSCLADDLRRLGWTNQLTCVLDTVVADRQYEGYIRRQRAEVKRQAEMERRTIPAEFDYQSVSGLRAEARQVLSRFRPSTLGQASRLEGVNPSDMTLLIVSLSRRSGSGNSRAVATPLA